MSAMPVISVQDQNYDAILLAAIKDYSVAVKSLIPDADTSDVDVAVPKINIALSIIKTALEQMRDLNKYNGEYASGDNSLYHTLGIWYALYGLAEPYMPDDSEYSFTGAARTLIELFDMSRRHVLYVTEMIYRPTTINPDMALGIFAYQTEEIPAMRNLRANQAVLHICDLLQNRPIIKANWETVLGFSKWHHKVYQARTRGEVFQKPKDR